MDHYNDSIDTFNRNASAYKDRFMDLDLYNESYDVFCDHITKPDANVFEIGCGPGNITRYLLNRKPGLRFLCTDAAPAMLELAKQNNPEIETQLLDCRNIQTQRFNFDAIVCGFCLPYLKKEDSAMLIKHCGSILNKNGVFYLSVIEGDYEKSGYEFSSDGKSKAFVYYYEEEFFQKTIINTDLTILKIWKLPYKKQDDSIQNHLILVFKKN